MKTIEMILLDLNKNNVNESAEAIQKQIDFFAGTRIEVDCISLMPVRDLLKGPKYADNILRSNGYILSIAQFKEDSEKFIKLAEKDPILHNSKLKRLYRAYQVLLENYINRNIHNKVVLDEMKGIFSQTLLDDYFSDKKMPKALSERIATMTEIEVEQLNGNWFKNNLVGESKKEFTNLLSSQLLCDWRAKNLDSGIMNQLEKEKDKINSIEALLTHFREKKLPTEIQDRIKAAVIAHIETNKTRINPGTELSDRIIAIRNARVDNAINSVLSEIIFEWQNTQSSDAVSKQLGVFVTEVIATMKKDLESGLTHQFDQLTTQIFLGKLQGNEYQPDLAKTTQKYAFTVAKQLLLPVTGGTDNLSKCKEVIYGQVMSELHKQWMNGGRLSGDESNFIKERTFASLNEIGDKIQENVWPNKNKQKMEALLQDNNALRTGVNELKTEVNELKILLQQLVADRSLIAANTVPTTTGAQETNVTTTFSANSLAFFK